MSEHYRVRVSQGHLAFSAAHFITYGGNICERLHGHNWRVVVEIAGPLDENQYVFDFVAAREALKGIIDELDHRMLLATRHPTIRVEAGAAEVEARFEERRWVFPRGDCCLLPIENTTAERLAWWIAHRLEPKLVGRPGSKSLALRVEVEEESGMWGICELGAENSS